MRANLLLQTYREGATLKIWRNTGGFSLHQVRKKFEYKSLLNIVRLNYPELTESETADMFVTFCVDNGYLTQDETVHVA